MKYTSHSGLLLLFKTLAGAHSFFVLNSSTVYYTIIFAYRFENKKRKLHFKYFAPEEKLINGWVVTKILV